LCTDEGYNGTSQSNANKRSPKNANPTPQHKCHAFLSANNKLNSNPPLNISEKDFHDAKKRAIHTPVKKDRLIQASKKNKITIEQQNQPFRFRFQKSTSNATTRHISGTKKF
jgi:hypothetical protein